MLLIIFLGVAGTAMSQTEWTYKSLIGLEPGPPGSWDSNGCWMQSIVFDGLTYHAFYTATRPDGLGWDVGHATSPDRVNWTKNPANPVLRNGAPGEWDDEGIAAGAVLWDGIEFHMWYGGLHNDNIERACYATSPDGTNWTKQVCNLPGLEPGVPNPWDERVVRPNTVIIEGNTYRMWYNGARYLGAPGWSARVGHAESLDGINWTKRPEAVFQSDPNSWESLSTGLPYVVFDGSRYHMWYTGGTQTSSDIDLKIGYAFSIDGINWTKSAANPIIEELGGFAASGPVVFDGETWHMWHTHSDGTFPWFVSYATSTCCAGIFGDDFETGDTSLWSTTVP
jgi:sucrose-6-phosphate hydrolase SacC (GH32 family)